MPFNEEHIKINYVDYETSRNRKKERYGVNIHDTKISHVQVNSKQRISALIAVLHQSLIIHSCKIASRVLEIVVTDVFCYQLSSCLLHKSGLDIHKNLSLFESPIIEF